MRKWLLLIGGLSAVMVVTGGGVADARYLHTAEAASATAIYTRHTTGLQQSAVRCWRASGKVLACWATITVLNDQGEPWEQRTLMTVAAHGRITRVSSLLSEERVDVGPTRSHFYSLPA